MKEYSKSKWDYSKNCYTQSRDADSPFHSYQEPQPQSRQGEDWDYFTIDKERKNKSHTFWVILPVGKRTQSKIEAQFNELSIKWKSETGLFSTTFHKVANDSYFDIIGLGQEVVPILLHDMQKPTGTAHWHTALKAITKENPVPPEDLNKSKKVKEAWILWGKSKRII
jgi:hypothetical protein